MRVARKQDLDQLYGIYSHDAVSPNMGFDPCTKEEFVEIFQELLLGGDLLVKEREEQIVAVCKVIRRKRRLRHSVYIGSLAVAAPVQGEGVGSNFFKEITDRLKAEGFSRIELLVAADNTKAIKFFEKFGFQIEGTHKDYFSRVGCESLFSEHTMAWVNSSL